MTIIIQEAESARDYESSAEILSIEVTFIVSGAIGDFPDDEGTVRAFIGNDGAPSVVDGAPISSITAIERINQVQYRAKILYETDVVETAGADVEESTDFSFDTTGGTIHIKNALEVLESKGNPSTEIGTSINVQPNGDVKGVDITSPVFNFSINRNLPDGEVTGGFVQKIYDQTGTVNEKTISVFGVIFNPRDILFLGAQGQVTEVLGDNVDDIWTINYRFAAQKGLQNIKVSDEITISEKAGWDYLSIQYHKVEDVGQSKIVPKPFAAYVMMVYEETAFGDLGAFNGS